MTAKPAKTESGMIFGLDILPHEVRPVTDPWPDLKPKADVTYRWLHFDLNLSESERWARVHLPDIVANALLQRDTRPRCEQMDNGLMLNLRGVNLTPGASPEDMVSLRLWVTEHTIVSMRGPRVWAAEEVYQQISAGNPPKDVGAFLHEIVHKLTQRIDNVSLELDDKTDDLESIDVTRVPLQTHEINQLRLTVIKMRRFVKPQREALADLLSSQSAILSAESLRKLRESANRTQRTLEELDATRDRLGLLIEHQQAHGAHMMNRNSYLLSVIAAIFLPLGFLTGLFGVNIGGMPGLENQWAFAILCVSSVLVGIALYVLFKLWRWL